MDFWQTNDIYFANTDTGWITDVFEGLSTTTNSGIDWVNISGIYQPRKFVLFPLNIRFWVYGFSHIYETTNNGGTWDETTPSIQVFSKFHAPFNYIGWGVGGGGYIVKYYDPSYVPVELTSFGGNIQNNEIILNWQTASELNNKGFYIEKSFDKIIWKEIGFVKGVGNSTEYHDYSYIDNTNLYETNYYRLKQIDYNGNYEYSDILKVSIILDNFQLFQNYPNPFNPITNINFNLPEISLVELTVYNILGQKVATLKNEILEAGSYSVPFSAEKLPSGIYIYTLRAGSFNKSAKMLLLK